MTSKSTILIFFIIKKNKLLFIYQQKNANKKT